MDDQRDRPPYQSRPQDDPRVFKGDCSAGVRVQGSDPCEGFVDYVTARLTEDPHLWVQTLLDELRPLGFEGSHPTLTGQIRTRSLRPACVACAHATKRPNAIIEHPGLLHG